MHILIIDDEKNIRQTISDILKDNGHTVCVSETGEIGLNRLRESLTDLVFLDVKLPGMNGIEVLKQIRKDWPTVDVLMISGDSDIGTAVNAVKLGAFDFMEKPLSLPKILITVQNIAEKRKLEQKQRIDDEIIDSKYRIIGESPKINAVREMINRVAKTDARVLITGESGTGKELVAYAIHQLSRRADEPFVTFNSAAIPHELVESELFGYEKGAFTGADRQKPGKLESANRGTIFLDEIGDMDIDAQSKILRVLEEGRFERVGGNRTIDIDVRILAATNRNIEGLIKSGTFREDLYYRLNVVPFYLPPLRERQGDISVLLEYYSRIFSRELAIPFKQFAPAALEFVEKYAFPGNIRELKNLVERLYILSDSDIIEEKDIRQYLVFKTVDPEEPLKKILQEDTFANAKESFEKYYFTVKLEQYKGNVSRLAGDIGILQPNLSRKLKTLGINI